MPEVGEACRLHGTHHGRSEATRARGEAEGKSEAAPEELVIGTETPLILPVVTHFLGMPLRDELNYE